jgi:DNA-binding GntR family transcriptional regulator
MSDNTLRQRAYELIQGKLLTGELRGGSLISENALAAEMGISRTPVREAIHQLEIEGFVEKVPRYGTLVRAPDRDEIRELFDLREALEIYAAAEAASRLSPADLEMLELLLSEMKAAAQEFRDSGRDFLDERMLRRFLTADMGFHMTLIRATNNRRFMKILTDFRVIQRIFGYHRVRHGRSVVEEACRQHGEILEAIRNGDADAARSAIARHIRTSKEHSLESLDLRAYGPGVMEEDRPSLPADLVQDIQGLPGLDRFRKAAVRRDDEVT